MNTAKELARALRSAVLNANDWRTAFLQVADAVEPQKEPAAETLYWHGPFEWAGRECPLPPETLVRVTLRDGSRMLEPAYDLGWYAGGEENYDDIVAFSYASPDPAGWIERPEGWVPPDEAFPAEMRDHYVNVSRWTKSSGLYQLSLDDHKITHIRLLPRDKAAGSVKERSYLDDDTWVGFSRRDTSGADIANPPADTRALVREALEAMLRHSGVADMDPRDKDPDDVIAESLARKALTALDAAPAEKVVEIE